MNVEIINVGTELLLGEIVNTNATYLQKMFSFKQWWEIIPKDF